MTEDDRTKNLSLQNLMPMLVVLESHLPTLAAGPWVATVLGLQDVPTLEFLLSVPEVIENVNKQMLPSLSHPYFLVWQLGMASAPWSTCTITTSSTTTSKAWSNPLPSMPCGGTCTSKARRSRSRPPPCLCVIRVHHE